MGNREALQREKATKAEELQKVQRSIALKTDQIRTAAKAGEDARKKLIRDVEDAKVAKERQQADMDRRLQLLRSEHPGAVEDSGGKAAFPSGGAAGDRLNDLLRENERLRRYSGQHRQSSGHLQDMGGQMQRSLSSMEDRAAGLRREMQR